MKNPKCPNIACNEQLLVFNRLDADGSELFDCPRCGEGWADWELRDYWGSLFDDDQDKTLLIGEAV